MASSVTSILSGIGSNSLKRLLPVRAKITLKEVKTNIRFLCTKDDDSNDRTLKASKISEGSNEIEKPALKGNNEVKEQQHIVSDKDFIKSLESESVHDLLEAAESTYPDVEPEFPSDLPRQQAQYKQYEKWHEGAKNRQGKHSFRPKVDPKETSLLLFPGQGSQFVGMAEKLLPYPNVREMFSLASDILQFDLLDICLHGPKEKLDRTEFCQPAIMVSSLAAVEKLRNENPEVVENCVGTAGFSVGEYAALVFAGAMSFEDAVNVVRVRAKAMQRASEANPSGMMTIFLKPESRLNFACHAAKLFCQRKLDMEDPVCSIANYLIPECKVIGGDQEALRFIQTNSKEFRLARLKQLPVSGAFHTSLMMSAKKPLQQALSRVKVKRPLIPVYSNVNSLRYRSPSDIENKLAMQIHKPVKWEQTMHVMYSRKQGEDFPYTYELGPGKQLGVLLKMVNRKAYQQYSAVDV